MPPEQTATPETGEATVPTPPQLDRQSTETNGHPAPAPDPTPSPAEDEPEDLTGLKRALKAEREARKAADKRVNELSPYEEAVKKAEEANKSETTKLNEALTGEREARTKAERELLKFTVAADKGVPANLVKFLAGTTKEEVEQSATELLAELGNTAKPSMPGRPTERLVDGRVSKSTLERDDPVTLIRKGRGEIP